MHFGKCLTTSDVSWWHTGHFVETIPTEVVAAVAGDVAEVTGTMGSGRDSGKVTGTLGSGRDRDKVAGTMGSGPVDVVEAEAALSRGLVLRIIPTLGIAVVGSLKSGLFLSIILTLRIAIVVIDMLSYHLGLMSFRKIFCSFPHLCCGPPKRSHHLVS